MGVDAVYGLGKRYFTFTPCPSPVMWAKGADAFRSCNPLPAIQRLPLSRREVGEGARG